MTNPDFYSLFAYGSAFLVSFIFASKYEKTELKKYVFLSLLVVILFCGCRFFVGNDYWGYYNIFLNIQRYPDFAWTLIEPAYGLINLIFSYSPIGYFFALFLSSAITFSLTFYILVKKHILKWGVFAIFTLGFLIIANDQVRQMIAVTIFFFAIRFIDEKKPFLFLLLVLLAATFHYSAIICALAYLLRYLKLNKKIVFLFLCLAFVVKLSGYMEDVFHNASQYIPSFLESYASKLDVERYYSGATFGMQLLYFFLVSAVIILLLPKKEFENIYIKIFAIGSCLYMLFWGQMLFERLSLYFFETIIVAFPTAMKQNKMICKLTVIICLLYFSLQSLFALEKNGAIPYRTFIHEEMVNPIYNKDTQSR